MTTITPITGSAPAADVAADLRALAVLAEADPFIAAVIERGMRELFWPEHAATHDTPEGYAFAVAAAKLGKLGAATDITTGQGYVRQHVKLRAITLHLIDRAPTGAES